MVWTYAPQSVEAEGNGVPDREDDQHQDHPSDTAAHDGAELIENRGHGAGGQSQGHQAGIRLSGR